MKAKEIQEILAFITKSGLEEVNIETGDFKIKVKKSLPEPKTTVIANPPATVPTTPTSLATIPTTPAPTLVPTEKEKETAPASESPAPEKSKSKFVEIKSPMIGTFYRATDPKSPPLVNVGDTIKPGKSVCIVEAMKLFNEIESEISGTIVEILVEDATPVEYDTPLFLVDPS